MRLSTSDGVLRPAPRRRSRQRGEAGEVHVAHRELRRLPRAASGNLPAVPVGPAAVPAPQIPRAQRLGVHRGGVHARAVGVHGDVAHAVLVERGVVAERARDAGVPAGRPPVAPSHREHAVRAHRADQKRPRGRGWGPWTVAAARYASKRQQPPWASVPESPPRPPRRTPTRMGFGAASAGAATARARDASPNPRDSRRLGGSPRTEAHPSRRPSPRACRPPSPRTRTSPPRPPRPRARPRRSLP